MSTEPARRKRQPEFIRRTLLSCARNLALERGLSGLTLQSIADAAGVTKGGLFHHFSSRRALLQEMYQDIVKALDSEIDQMIADDKERWGSFTRAYISMLLSIDSLERKTPMALVSIALDQGSWPSPSRADWLSSRLQRHAETDSDPQLEVVRFAADGAWLSYPRARNQADYRLLLGRLKIMTQKASREVLPIPASGVMSSNAGRKRP